MNSKLIFLILVVCNLIFFVRCHKGCTDNVASNYDSKAKKSNGACIYKLPISNPSFEEQNSTWYPEYAAGPSCANIIKSNVADGFMPTDGNYYYKIIPQNCSYGITWLTTSCGSTEHFKGFYFDYSYQGVGGSDSTLNATIEIGLQYGGGPNILWHKTISENKISFGGLPIVSYQKKNEFCEFPNQNGSNSHFYISISGIETFTFEIDNIRSILR